MDNESLNTGANDLVAADQEEINEQDVVEEEDMTMSEFEITEDVEELTLDEVLNGEAEGNGENEGVTDPPKQSEKDEDQQDVGKTQDADEKPADYYRSQEEVDAIVQKRVRETKEKTEAKTRQAVRAEIEAEYAAKFGVPVEKLGEVAIENKARELMEKFPKEITTLEYAKVLAQGQLPQTPPAPQTQQSNPQQTDNGQADTGKQAFEKSLREAEEAIKSVTGNKTFSIAELYRTNSFFKSALTANQDNPLQAYRDAMDAQAQHEDTLKAAKEQGQREVVDKIRKNAGRGMKNTGRGTGKAKRTINDLTDAELDKISAFIEGGGKVSFD